MPYTLNGFGTKFYGKRDQAADGSYVTTKWLTALYVPVIPVGSYRVKPVGQGTNWGIHRSQNYQVQNLPLCWEQVWNIYMIAAPILFLGGWLIWWGSKNEQAVNALHAQMDATAAEIKTTRASAEKLQSECRQELRRPGADTDDRQTRLQGLEDKCGPVRPAIDAYVVKVDQMQRVIAGGLAQAALPQKERNRLSALQAIWKIRRDQALQSEQIAACYESPTRECSSGLTQISARMDTEDQQACRLVESIGEKCK